MSYGNFPRYNRWLEFESRGDYLKYQQKSKRGEAWWQRSVEEQLAKFESLIDRQASEPRIHEFLERHAYFLPGFGDLHHGPYGGAIATKLPLGQSFVTDFAYVASN